MQHDRAASLGPRALDVRRRVSVLLMAMAPVGMFMGAAIGDDAPASSPGPVVADSLEITDCLTRFPYRRRLASERSGILAETPDEGDRFAPGDLVARLRDAVPRAALAVAEKKAANDSDLRRAVKAHELAKFGFDRMQAANAARPNTFDADEIKQRELETATAALQVEVAQNEFDVARLELEQHRAELSTYEIRTDRGGIVTRVVKRDGEGVQLGEEVLEIVDTSVVRVEGYADGAWLPQLRPGLPVTIVVEVPGSSPNGREVRLQGELGFVDVSLTSGGEVRVWVDAANPGNSLVEGLRGRLILGSPR